jgi:PAS domain S-box-containing protein
LGAKGGDDVKILLVEDNPGDARLIQVYLAEAGMAELEMVHTDRLAEGLKQARTAGFDVVLLDLSLPDASGLEGLTKMREAAPARPIVVLTGLNDEIVALEALRRGAQDYLIKDQIGSELLARAIRYAIERKQAESALRERMKELDCLYGMARLVEKPGIEHDELMQGVADLLARAMQHPDAAGASIRIGEREYRTPNWDGTSLRIQEPIRLEGIESGVVGLGYATETGQSGLSFLPEEHNLLIAVAERLGRILERMHATVALRESEERYRDLFENATDLIQSVGSDGKYIFTNRRWRETLGYTKDEVTRLTMYDVLAPDCHDHCRQLFGGLMQGAQVECSETTFLTKDGRRVVVEGNLSCHSKDGKPVATRGFFRDITERRRAEAALRESEERMRTITGSAKDAIIMMDDSGLVTFWNPAAEATFGYAATEVIGRNLHEFLPPERFRAAHRAAFGRFQATGEGGAVDKTLELAAIRRDGTEIPVELSLSAIKIGDKWHAVGIARDITERKRAESEIAQLSRQNQLILDAAGEGIIGLDDAGRCTFVNPAAVQMLGYDPRELVGQPLHALTHHTKADGAAYPPEECPIYLAFNDGLTHMVEDELFWRQDGTSFPVEYTSTPVRDGKRLTGAVVTFKDITERKQAEEEIGLKAELLDASTDSIFLHDLDGRFLYVNEASYKTRGYTKEEFLALNLRDLDVPEYAARIAPRIADLQRTGDETFESAQFRRDRSVMPVEVHARILEISGRKLILGVIRDITERKHAEAVLAESELKFRTVFESSNDAMMLLDSESFIDCNPATLRVFGYTTRDSFLGKHPGEVSPPLQADGRESRVAADENIAAAFRDGRNFFEWLHQRADGTVFPADVLLTPLDYRGRKVLQATVRDITARKIAEAEIAQKNVELVELNKVKNQLLGMAAHDLRNPLSVVSASSAFLLDESSRHLPDAKRDNFIRRINSSSKFMLKLIDDLLDVAKIEAGRLDLQLKEEDLCGLIEDTLTLNRMLADKKRIRLDFAPECGLQVLPLDRGKVEQVLNNLFSNAIKFSAPGTAVTVQASRVNGSVLVSVRDQGQGIPPEELDKLFKPFSKTSVRATAGESSTGLGLAICRKIIEGHGGRIWAESEVGKGSTFSFSLPVASDEARASGPESLTRQETNSAS